MNRMVFCLFNKIRPFTPNKSSLPKSRTKISQGDPMIVRIPEASVRRLKAEQYIHNTYMITKELVENALDSCSTIIMVSVKHNEIIVEDNGTGIAEDSLNLLGEFGCTSKHNTTHSMLNLKQNSNETYGFRGQALYSIASMSDLTIRTSSNDGGIGFNKEFKTGKVEQITKQKGTTVQITEIFNKCPVRKTINNKAYRRNITQIGEWLEGICVVYSGTIIFKYTDNKKEKEIVYKGCGDNLITFLKQKFGNHLLQYKDELFDIYFFPQSVISTSLMFYGRRLIKSNLRNVIDKAVAKYTDNKPTHVLFIKDVCDINISVDKSEVIINNRDQIENTLKRQIEIFMENSRHVDSLTITRTVEEDKIIKIANKLIEQPVNTFNRQKTIATPVQSNWFKPKVEPINAKQEEKEEIVEQPTQIKKQKVIRSRIELDLVVEKADFTKMEIIGQMNAGFILCKLDKTTKKYLILIDQHAADEIKNYECIKRQFNITKQKLINKVSLNLSQYQRMLVDENISVFNRNGFEVEFDDSAAYLTSVPFYKDKCFTADDFYNLLNKINDSDDLDECACDKFNEIMASKACRSSVMISKHLSQNQMEQIVRNLAHLKLPWNCPHGRPTFIVLKEMAH
ncbi:DNA mismatch repair [Enterospora canceri]|uniref:DNA mismatch repair n=1 Tax=Enterospora canceri TaxID=1081671 RepID=A0A1Y1S9P0_9MICR|nr:DNA mismatch repair [Enterospora canceri]